MRSILYVAVAAALAPMTVVACGGSDGVGTVTPTGTFTHYVVSDVEAPKSASDQAIVKIDGNHKPVETGGTAVNQLGALIAALKTAGNVDVQTPLSATVQDGSIVLLADFQADSLTSSAGAGLQVFLGSKPTNPAPCTDPTDSTTCGQHLKGDGNFTVDPNSPDNAALAGPLVNGEFNGDPGKVTVEFSLAATGGGGGAPLLINLLDAHASMSGISATGI